MPDDIRTDRLPASSTEKADGTEPPFTSPPKRTPRVVGPESEVLERYWMVTLGCSAWYFLTSACSTGSAPLALK